MYEPGCLFRIPDLDFFPSRIPDPGVKKAPDPDSGRALNDFFSLAGLDTSILWYGTSPRPSMRWARRKSPSLFSSTRRTLALTFPARTSKSSGTAGVNEPVLRILDILVRIRIRGSVPLTNGSGFGFSMFFCLLLFEATFTSFFEDKKVINKSQNSRN